MITSISEINVNNNYRKDIDGLRAIAILSVVTYHAFPNLLPGGFIGVDIFFVISGFLITGVILQHLNQDQFSFIDFYSRRIRRIFPALLVVLLSAYAWGWFHQMADEYAQLGKHIAAGAGFISNLVLWGESGYFDKSAVTKPLLNLWSLGVEEQYYIVWPMVLWIFFRRQWSMFYLIITALVISFVWNLLLIKVDPTATFYAPWTRFWELLIGSSLAYLQSKTVSIPLRWLALVQNSWLGFALCIIGFWQIDAQLFFPGWWGLLPTMGAFILIFAGPQADLNRIILSNPLMVGIGKISYPLYLWHWPILVFGAARLDHPPGVIYQITCVVLAIVLAIVTYFVIEKPIRFNRSFQRSKTITLVVLMILIGFIGYNCYSRGGIEYRHKDFIKQVSGYQFDKVKEQRQHECFVMDSKEDLSHFATSCIHTESAFKVVLWGDSHGGSIYPGFAELEKNYPVSVSQFTIAGCGGLIPDRAKEMGNPDPVIKFCNDANQMALDQIVRLHPQLLVIHKSWQTHMFEPLEQTIQYLQSQNINIALIGPTPVWTQDLPRIVYRYWKTHQVLPPAYFDQYLNSEVIQREQRLREISQKYHLSYYSAYQRLCKNEACLVMIPEADHALTTMDQDHITPAAGRYIIQGFSQEIIQPALESFAKSH
jgi:peptidoglycan/LPS O-acetylase OafA/YrhL